MIKVTLFCLFVLSFTVWAQELQYPFPMRNYGCPACACGTATGAGLACPIIGGGSCFCTPGAGTTCTVGGTTTSNGCLSNNTVTCVNFATDSNNCGSCGNKCPAGTVCSGSACQTACPSGEILCGGVCISTSTNTNNCGSCGNICPSGIACVNGVCGACSEGLIPCNGACIAVGDNNCGIGAAACGAPCNSTSIAPFCVLSTGTCGAIPYGTGVCDTTLDISTNGLIPAGSIYVPYPATYTPDNCYNFCHTTVSTPTYFSLALDSSTGTGVNYICQCYIGTPTAIAGGGTTCANGYGITTGGGPAVEIYPMT